MTNKRWLRKSMTLVLMVAVTLASMMNGTRLYAEEVYRFATDFNSYAHNVRPDAEFDSIKEEGPTQNRGYMRVKDFPDSTNKSLHILDAGVDTSKGRAVLLKNFPEQTGKTTFQWKFYNENGTDKKGTQRFFINGHNAEGVMTNALRIGIRNDTAEVVQVKASGMTPLAQIQPANWYTLTLVADAAAQQFEVYLNGVIILNDQPFEKAVTDIRQFEINTGYYANTAISLYVDDLLIEGQEVIPAAAEFEQVELTAANRELRRGEQTSLQAKLVNDDGTGIIGSYTIQYTSSNPSVATVDPQGIVTAVDAGEAVITAEATVDGVTKSGSASIQVLKNQLAELTSIGIGGVPLESFSADKTVYTVELEHTGSVIPEVTAVASSLGIATVTQATHIPGQAAILVVSEDETVTKTYTINFIVEGMSSNSHLSDIKLDGQSMTGFHKDTLEYIFYYDNSLPAVTVVQEDMTAQVAMQTEADDTGRSQYVLIRVTASDTLNWKEYRLKLVQRHTLYVSPHGNDTWSGLLSSPVMNSTDGPLRTVEKSKAVVRELKASGMSGDITVYFREGQYPFDNPVTFSEEDSGVDGFRVIYKSYPGEEAVFNGGFKVTDWEQHQGSIYRAYVGTDTRIEILSENNEMSVVSRHPNADAYNGVTQEVYGELRRKFIFGEGDIPYVTDPQGMQVWMWNGAHRNWYGWYKDVASIDYASRTVSLTADMGANMAATTRYFVQNAYELLDSPGEFYHDMKGGFLYYWPKGESIEDADIYAGKSSGILRFVGTAASPAKHISVEGIRITNANSDALIHMGFATEIDIRFNKIQNNYSNGIKMANGAYLNTVYGNELFNIGYNGIDIAGSAAMTKTLNTTHSNTMSNNYIHHTGKINKHGAGIYIHSSGNNQITHNKIYYTPRYAISLKFPHSLFANKVVDGVPINKDPESLYYHGNFNQTRDNYIAFNDVSYGNYDSSDTGLIESYGARRNTIHNNIVHDSYINDSFGFGIYMDDGSDEFTITNNVIYNTQMEGLGDGSLYSPLVLKGKNNKATNNIIADNDAFRGHVFLQQNSDQPNRDIELERNIYYDNGQSLYFFVNWTDNNPDPLRNAQPGDRLKISDYNVFYNADDRYSFYTVPGVKGFEDWRNLLNKRYDQHSVMADPLFIDRENRDYRLQYNSPAYALGFKDVDFASVGLKADFPYANVHEAIDKVYVRAAQSGNNPVVSLAVEEETDLELVVRTQSGYIADLGAAAISYTSADPGIASVDEHGKVTGNSPGLTMLQVTVQAGGATKSTSIYVSVGRGMEELVVSSPLHQLAVTQSTMLLSYGKTADGVHVDLKNEPSLVFASSNDAIATVDTAGKITGISAGTAEITISVTKDGQLHTKSLSIQVFDNPLSSVKVSMKSMMDLGEQFQSTVNAALYDGAAAPTTVQSIYTSSDPAVVHIDQAGLITAAAPGSAEIVTTVTLDGVQKTHRNKVTVIDPNPDLNGYRLVNYGNVRSTASYDREKDEYTIVATANGSGTNKPAEDAFASVVRNVYVPNGTSTFKISAHVSYIEQQNNQAITAGIFLKDGYGDGAKMISLRTQVDGGTTMNFRTAENEAAAQTVTHWIQHPIDLLLEKEGSTIHAYYQMEGGKKHHFQTIEFDLGNEFVVGIFAFNHMSPLVPTEYKISNLVLTPDLSDQDAVIPSPNPDTAPPSSPVLMTTGADSSSASLTWTEAADNVGVAGYELYMNGDLVNATVTSVTYATYGTIVNGLTAGTSYTFQVAAVDAAGNRGRSNTVMVTTDEAVTSTPPEEVETQPQGGSVPVPVPVPDSLAVMVVSEEILQASKEGVVKVKFPDGANEVLLPGHAADLIGSNSLEIELEHVTLVISPELLEQLKSQLGLEHSGSTISLSASIVPQDAADQALQAAGDSTGAKLALAGEMIEFTLALKNEQGQSVVVSEFEDTPIILRLPVFANADKRLVGVYYIDASGTATYVGGALSSDEAGIEAGVTHFSRYAVLEYAVTFEDVKPNHWAYEGIRELAAKHIVNGINDIEFAPEADVTRAEFAALLVRALELKGTGNARFEDVAKGSWYEQAVSAAVVAGIINGVSPTSFKPNAAISREEMAVMLVRAYEGRGGKAAAVQAAEAFADQAETAEWALDSVATARQLELLSGRGDGVFAPSAVMTRAEAVQALLNLISKLAP
jgi:hypothetical protein